MVGAGEVGFDGGFEFVDDRQAALDFRHNAALFREGREKYDKIFNVAQAKEGLINSQFH